jgi:hypothetical protein
MIVTEKRVFVIKKCGVVVTDKHSSSDGLAPIQICIKICTKLLQRSFIGAEQLTMLRSVRLFVSTISLLDQVQR